MFKYSLLLSIVAISFAVSPCLPTGSESQDMTQLKRQMDIWLEGGRRQKAAVGVIDLNSGDVMFENGGKRYNPASVIKLAVMVAVFDCIENGRFGLNTLVTLQRNDKIPGAGALYYLPAGGQYSVQKLMDTMIIDSDNTATRMLINLVGIQTLNRVIRDAGMMDTVVGTSNLLEAEGKNYSTVADISSLLYKIASRKIVSPWACDQMLAILCRQKSKWGLPHLLPADIVVAHKTGSLNLTRHDAGIVYLPSGPYVITVFTQDVNTNEEGRRIVAETSYRVFQWMMQNRNRQKRGLTENKATPPRPAVIQNT